MLDCWKRLLADLACNAYEANETCSKSSHAARLRNCCRTTRCVDCEVLVGVDCDLKVVYPYCVAETGVCASLDYETCAVGASIKCPCVGKL